VNERRSIRFPQHTFSSGAGSCPGFFLLNGTVSQTECKTLDTAVEKYPKKSPRGLPRGP